MGEAAGEADQLLEAELLGPAHEVSAELPGAARHEAGPVMSGVRYQATVKTELSGTSHLPGLHLLSPLTPQPPLDLRGSVGQQVASQGLSCPHHLTCFFI